MNYRHAYHAGNFADCVKHALLVDWLRRLRRKQAPFVVLDTHAGAGRFALDTDEATRTGEWRGGIGRLLEDAPEILGDYVDLVRRSGLYPGSPSIARALLRPQDRLIACELHPEEFAALRATLGRDAQCAAHHRDGYEAIGALLPPRPARGVVMIDPPFEQAGEFELLADAVRRARARFPTGGVLAWYPIKGRTGSRSFHASLAGVRDMVVFELWLRPPVDASRLNGCGLLAAAPPWGLEDDAPALLSALLDRLGTGEDGGWQVVRTAPE